jgi:TRAP-type C4-dicarboxylate transport system permease large subunit
MGGNSGVIQILSNGFGSLSSFSLVPIPLFLLMGELFFRTGLGMRMFNAIDMLLGKVPGRLSYVTVIGGTGFATVSGSSMGSTALLGSVLVPEMVRRGYKKHMAIGPILGTGGLAIIIPPSALSVLLATLAKIDVGALLVAGRGVHARPWSSRGPSSRPQRVHMIPDFRSYVF